jgi:hypothetical protein
MGSMLQTLNRMLGATDLEARRRSVLREDELERQGLQAWVQLLASAPPPNGQGVGVVFSMDRALQLHALLGSYFELVRDPAPLHILFRATSPGHRQAFDEVFTLFQDRPITVVEQDDRPFKDQLLGIVGALAEDRLFFLVDDDLFVEPLDLPTFLAHDVRQVVPSLRMGVHLDRCYVAQQPQPLPEDLVRDTDHLEWDWRTGVHDWAYPLSLTGHLFDRREMEVMLAHTTYRSPNTLEVALQRFLPVMAARRGWSFQKSRLVNIPCNKVQTDNDNIHGGVHQDDLLRHWQDGRQLDYRSLYGAVNTSVHQELDLRFIPRSG